MDEISLPVTSRIAPTPSGYLHIGNAVNFILTWLYVKKFKGELILRIDDLDSSRVRDEYLDDIFIQLERLGLTYDKGPSGVEDFKKKYSQKNREGLYNDFVNSLEVNHATLYNCSCSRKKIKKETGDGIYRGSCRNLNLERCDQHNVRIVVKEEFNYHSNLKQINLFEHMGDFVLIQKGGVPSYQVASLVDDLLFKVNLIVRGEDLLPSTAAQNYLSRFGPASRFTEVYFIHHPLLKDKDGNKMSKSAGSNSLKEFSKSDHNLQYIYNLVAEMIGIKEKVETLDDLLNEFISFECSHDFFEAKLEN